jgi:very-short-patch-repair endonuclease
MDRKHNKKLTPLARNLRKNMTPEERHLWYDFLKNYPVKFLRQKVIDNYIADFYCSSAKLVVELDGSQHNTEKGIRSDEIRTQCIARRNITVIRIKNSDIQHNFQSVCEYIDYRVRKADSKD